MKYKLVIFDMDGTILDTLEDLANTANYALHTNGFPERTKDEVRQFVGNGILKLIERATPEGTTQEQIGKTFETFIEYYKDHKSDTTKPYPQIMELLIALKEAGHKLAVVSNKADQAVKDLCLEYFPNIFDAAIGERVGVAKKPAPDSVNEVMKELACAPEDTVYVGDSDVDVMTAKNANVTCIGVTWGFREKELLESTGANFIVFSATEIFEIVK